MWGHKVTRLEGLSIWDARNVTNETIMGEHTGFINPSSPSLTRLSQKNRHVTTLEPGFIGDPTYNLSK